MRYGNRFASTALLAAGLVFGFASARLAAEDEAAAEEAAAPITLSDGKIRLVALKSFEKQEPRTKIVEYEFSAPAAGDDETDGRLTIMGAGGSVEANIERWIGQFVQPDGSPTSEQAEIREEEIGGQKVHVVDVSGDYKDQRGPFAPAVMRSGYRMLGAIIVTEKAGQYFLKFYGPAATIEAHEEAFFALVESLEVEE